VLDIVARDILILKLNGNLTVFSFTVVSKVTLKLIVVGLSNPSGVVLEVVDRYQGLVHKAIGLPLEVTGF